MALVATFNIRHGAPAEAGPRLGDTAAACLGLGVDLLALQEVERRCTRSRGWDQGAVVARRCGLHAWFAPAVPNRWGGGYGQALLSGEPLAARQVLELPTAGGERRVALLASARLDAVAVSVAATHLAAERGALELQLPALLEQLLRRPGPHLLLGDLNADDARVRPILATAGFEVAETGPTFPATSPRRRIDWVAARGLSVGPARVPAAEVSDHRPVVARVGESSCCRPQGPFVPSPTEGTRERCEEPPPR